ncbi:wall-associated receptor kinase 1-like [Triticum dicoccoides]|uniref:wall-associated receptor kinase 1-like n=1 Tax=Triticum dicoccoides TaxID=85692 RepID=UPI00189115DF|nr:wall-associated receptor kinase 1-like [Triticum dicoccoides]
MPPRLFLHDGTTEVIDDIITPGFGSYNHYQDVDIQFSHVITLKPGLNEYTVPWKAPGRSFSLDTAYFNITGCDFDIYQLDRDLNTGQRLCTVRCPNEQITDLMARESCNGTGCCSIMMEGSDFELKFIRHGVEKDQPPPHKRSTLWNRINVTSWHFGLTWTIADESSCSAALDNMTNYACVSSHSVCMPNNLRSIIGYMCACDEGYAGNAYITDGCHRDKGYNPVQQKSNCTRNCGNISVPFPFGLEEGCFARESFHLKCTDMTSSTLQFGYEGGDRQYITYISISEGHVGFEYTSNYMEPFFRSLVDNEPNLYRGLGQSASVQWAVANLTCQEARLNSSGYACVSVNSICLGVSSTNEYRNVYIGYRCMCKDGFQGNPYIPSGCEDIDECETPGICKGVCHNTIGSHNCTAYLMNTVIAGIVIGLSVGFGILLLIIIAIFLIRRWKLDIKKQLRRKYFKKNQGLLLEQLISSDENASDKTKIFSLAELQKATNNFDHTRIVGRGGHGMVYKGILSDQRVVAIKKSKVTAQIEISQFINEVAILSQINQRNIVKLFGCCLETEVPLLVYDFIPNGSLFGVLHNPNNNSSLSWDDCLRIAIEAAGALSYLHSAASVSIFHRDVKSTNILLDGNYTAKVSDFGASRLVPIDQTHVMTNIQGTFGYLDPEYYHTGILNEKSDVYSFGTVLVELLLRKEPIFTTDSGLKQNLSNYFLWEIREKPLAEIVAAQVLKEATKEEISGVACVAEICLRLRGEERPTMKQVEMKLQHLRLERLRMCELAAKDEDIQPLSTVQSQVGHRSLATAARKVGSSNSSSERSQNCYSLEQEFMSSATLPR